VRDAVGGAAGGQLGEQPGLPGRGPGRQPVEPDDRFDHVGVTEPGQVRGAVVELQRQPP
jgi:hypothetical protein